MLVVDVDDGLVREVGRDSETVVLIRGEIESVGTRDDRSLRLDGDPAFSLLLDTFDCTPRQRGRRSVRKGNDDSR